MRCGLSACLVVLLVPGAAPGGSLSGKVTRRDTGDPVAGAQVLIRGTGRVTESGPEGAYAFDSVPAGTYGISCSAAGLRGESTGPLSIGDDTVQDIELRPPGEETTRISGVVTCGEPCHGALIIAREGGTTRVAVGDPAGGFSIESVPSGTYQVRGFAFGHLPDGVSDLVIDPPPDGGSMTPREVNLDLLSGERYSVSGVVGLSDNPLERDGTTVRCNGLIPTASASTSSGGSYQLTGLPAGLLSFTAARTGYQSSTHIDVLVDSDRRLDFILTGNGGEVEPGYSLSGTVNLEVPDQADGGSPVDPAGSRVSIWAVDGHVRRTAVTGGNGQYTLSGIAPGTYQAGADREGFLPQVVESFQLSANRNQNFTLEIDSAYDWGPGADDPAAACGCRGGRASSVWMVLFLGIGWALRKNGWIG